MGNQKYPIRKTLRLTEQEAKQLSEQAVKLHLSEAEYLRFLLNQKPSNHPEVQLRLQELKNEINHIGVNINQIVYHHNSNLYLKKDKILLVANMKKIYAAMKEVSQRLGN